MSPAAGDHRAPRASKGAAAPSAIYRFGRALGRGTWGQVGSARSEWMPPGQKKKKIWRAASGRVRPAGPCRRRRARVGTGESASRFFRAQWSLHWPSIAFPCGEGHSFYLISGDFQPSILATSARDASPAERPLGEKSQRVGGKGRF